MPERGLCLTLVTWATCAWWGGMESNWCTQKKVKDIIARVPSSFTVSFFKKFYINGLIIFISEVHKRKFSKPSKLLKVPFQECNLKCNSDWDVKLIICYQYLS